ncbi:MAG: hypothetical protein WEB02_06875 [Methylophaga sp.]
MSAWLLVIAVLGVVLLAGCLWWRHQRTKSILSTSVKPPTKRFHGVSIRPTSGACRDVQAIAGKHFLPNEAPSLPLASCDVAYCGCRYEHHQDRRTQIDRRHDHIDIETQRPSKEHREKADRRQGRM